MIAARIRVCLSTREARQSLLHTSTQAYLGVLQTNMTHLRLILQLMLSGHTVIVVCII